MTVTATNVATNVSSTTATTGEGLFTIPYLTPGTYTVAAELSGFKKSVREGLEVRIGDRLVVDLSMEVGQLEETVLVTAQSPLLEMGSASAGQVIDEKRISMMPLSDGNPFVLSRLVPGVAFTGDLKFSRPFDNAGTSGINADGASGGNEFTLDGSPNMTSGRRVAFVPPAGAVQQFKVGTATFDAGDGHTAGAVVNVTLKSGTNSLKGEGYYYLRRDELSSHRLLRQQDRRGEAGPEVQPSGRLPRRAAALESHVLLRSGGVALRHVPRAAAADGADAGDAQRRLLGAAGAGHHHLRSGDGDTGRRPRRAATVSREHHPGESHQPDRGCRAEVLSAAESGRRTIRGGTTSSTSILATTRSTRRRRASITG